MKPVLAKTLFAAVLLTNLSAFAQGLNAQLSKASGTLAKGGVATGGGDLCEDRIQSIRDDLKKWIVEGGSQSLKLPAGFTTQKYKDEMLEKIQSTSVRCVGNGDAGYPVTVEGSAKVCRFDRSNSSNLITCDYKKFQAMSESDQYVLVHHEYAGLADVERPNGSDSDYGVSNQISSSLENQVVKKLVVKSGTESFKKMPAHLLQDYIKSTIIAENQTFVCGYFQTNFPVLLQDMISGAKFGSFKESGSKVSFVFETDLNHSEDRTAPADQRNTVRVDFDGEKVTGVSVLIQMYGDVNEGTLSKPKIVQGFTSSKTKKCERVKK